MTSNHLRGYQERRRQEVEQHQAVEQCCRAEEQRRRVAKSLYRQRRPIAEGNCEIERHYQWAIDQAQERDEDAFHPDAIEFEADYAQAMTVYQ